MRTLSAQVVLAHPTDRFPVFQAGPSGNVFQSPDMTAGRGVFQSAERGNSLSSHYIIGRGEAQNETPFKNFFANSSN